MTRSKDSQSSSHLLSLLLFYWCRFSLTLSLCSNPPLHALLSPCSLFFFFLVESVSVSVLAVPWESVKGPVLSKLLVLHPSSRTSLEGLCTLTWSNIFSPLFTSFKNLLASVQNRFSLYVSHAFGQGWKQNSWKVVADDRIITCVSCSTHFLRSEAITILIKSWIFLFLGPFLTDWPETNSHI